MKKFLALAVSFGLISSQVTPMSYAFAQEVPQSSVSETTDALSQSQEKSPDLATGKVTEQDGKTGQENLTTDKSVLEDSENLESSQLQNLDQPNSELSKKKLPPIEPLAATQSSSLPNGPSGDFLNQSAGKTQLEPQIDSSSGALIFNYPIQVPPGRNGLQPDLNLSYNSQLAQDTNTVFGSGWFLNTPYIERLNKKGLENFFSQTNFVSSLSGELATTSNSSNFVSKVEDGSFFKYIYSSNYWLAQDKNGTQYKFGYTANARQDNASSTGQISKWLLEEIRDTNDNYIKYTYTKDNGQIYPYKIIYTGSGSTDGIFEVEFLKEARTDTTKSFKQGFEAKINYRIYEIQTKINSNWVKKYSLTYNTGNNTNNSLITSVTETGKDEQGNTLALPATTFEYESLTSRLHWIDGDIWNAPKNINHLDGGMFADVNGDGLDDILIASVTSGVSTRETYINNNNGGWDRNTNYDPPFDFIQKLANNNDRDLGAVAVDLNGDGLNDLIRSSQYNSTLAYLNNGNGWTLNNNWIPDMGMFSSEERKIILGNINGDGLPDMLIVREEWWASDNSYHKVSYAYLNNGNGFTLTTTDWNSPVYFTPSNGAFFSDVNNDGLDDILLAYVNGSGVSTRQAYLNNGHGEWDRNTNFDPPFDFVNSSTAQVYGARALDLNGDGLNDLVRYGSTASYRDAYINTGKGWVSDSNWLLQLSLMPNPFGSNNPHPTTYIANVNNDGRPDLIQTKLPAYSQTPLSTLVSLNRELKVDMLKKVSYTTGGFTNITYKNSAQFINAQNILLNPNLPLNISLVSESSTNDGLGNASTQTASYEGGKYYFANSFEKKFAGFNKVTKTDSLGNKNVSYFHQGDTSNSSQGEYNDNFWKIGKNYRTENQNSNGSVYATTVNKWDSSDLGFGSSLVKLAQSLAQEFNGNSSHKDKAESFSYDNTTGNLVQKIAYGEVLGNTDGSFTDTASDKYTSDYLYASSSAANIFSTPYKVTTNNQAGQKVKEDLFYYDSLGLGSVTKGNLTKQEQWQTGSTYVNNQKTYNGYGLITSSTDPKSKTTNYTYDSYNLYPTSVVNPLTQTSQFSYDYSSGKVLQTTDPNGLINQAVYDAFDRILQQKQPDLVSTSTLVSKIVYQYTDTANSVSVKKTEYLDNTTSKDSLVYYDGLGRPIQTKKEAETAGLFTTTDTVYNSLGLEDKISLPYFSSGESKTSPTSDTTLYTNYSYDPLKRVVLQTDNVGSVITSYEDWQTNITDPNGKLKKLYTDAYGRLIKVEELNSGSTYATNYSYGFGNTLTNITDALGNVRNFTYNGLEQRLSAEDLHAPADATFGTWNYSYDAAGNLTQTIDPKNQTVVYTYDNLNRITVENFTGLSGNEKTYSYDSCSYGKGKLCSATVTGLTTETTNYNALGLPTSQTKTINSVNYTTTYNYDRQGNLVSFVNPDSSEIKYIYNSAGLLESVQKKETTDGSYINVVTNFDYSSTEKPTTITFTNGVTTTNTYDPSKLYRLTAKLTSNASTTKLQDLSYVYDANGNITLATDNSQTDAKKTVTYNYDDLNRLTSATATNPAAGQTGFTQTYSYNAIGNILTKSDQGSYSYTDSGYSNPHAATSITLGTSTPLTLSYDNNGNVSGTSAGLTNTWNYLNQLTQTVVGTATSTYAYDHTGQRISQVTPSLTTIYAGKTYSLEGSNKIKHIFAGDLLLATIKGTGASSTVYSIATDILSGSSVVTNSSGAVEEVMDYFPYGNIRLDQKANGFSEQRKFIGQVYDPTTGLNYLNARYYDSNKARFFSQDPLFWSLPARYLSDPQEQNSYSYARNNPITKSDPSGLFVATVPGTQVFGTRKEWNSTNLSKNISSSFPNENSATFQWGGSDNKKARTKASGELGSWLNSQMSGLPTNEPLNIVCHSHGCNVVAQYLSGKDSKSVKNLITLGVPVRNDYSFDKNKIENFINVYSSKDAIQKAGGGSNTVTGLYGKAFGSLFGGTGAKIGGFIGNSIGWGEFGKAERTIPNADYNLDARQETNSGYFDNHKDLHSNSRVWESFVDKNLK